MSKLKIAYKNLDRFNEDFLRLLKYCEIFIDNDKDQSKAVVSNFQEEIYYLHNGEIPQNGPEIVFKTFLRDSLKVRFGSYMLLFKPASLLGSFTVKV